MTLFQALMQTHDAVSTEFHSNHQEVANNLHSNGYHSDDEGSNTTGDELLGNHGNNEVTRVRLVQFMKNNDEPLVSCLTIRLYKNVYICFCI